MTDYKNNNGPWNRRQDDGPPDLIHLIKSFFLGKSADSSSKKPDHFGLFLGLGALLLVLVWALSGIFLVSPAEQAVITRFGKYVGTVDPGPHWIPRLIEREETLNVQQVSNFSYTAEMLTEDGSIVSVSLAVQYRIANPKNFLFNVINPVNTLQQATYSALRQVVGHMPLDEVLTKGRQYLRDTVEKQLKQTLNLYRTGLEVTDVTLQPAQAPDAVTHAFDDAIKALEDEKRYISQAEAYARRVELINNGRIARIQKAANAYQRSTVLKAQGETARYLALLKPYEEAPNVTRERMYLDTLSNVLSRTTNIVVDSSGNNVLYLPLDQILKRQHSMGGKTVVSNSNTDSLQTATQESDRPSYQAAGDDS